MDAKLHRKLRYAERLAGCVPARIGALISEYIAEAVEFWTDGRDDAAQMFARQAVELARRGRNRKAVAHAAR